jgi:hypothetical protein
MVHISGDWTRSTAHSVENGQVEQDGLYIFSSPIGYNAEYMPYSLKAILILFSHLRLDIPKYIFASGFQSILVGETERITSLGRPSCIG